MARNGMWGSSDKGILDEMKGDQSEFSISLISLKDRLDFVANSCVSTRSTFTFHESDGQKI
jgi:hypothetical protein